MKCRSCVRFSGSVLGFFVLIGCRVDQTGTGYAGQSGVAGVPAPVAGSMGSMAGSPAAGGGAGAGSSAPPGGSGGSSAGSGAAVGGSGGMTAPGSPTFSAIFDEIINGTGCNGAALCHGGPAGGKLTMNDKNDTHAALVGVNAMGMSLPAGSNPDCKDSGLVRVVAGKPEDSLLVQKIEQAKAPCGQSMPPTGPLSAAQIQQIKTWIMNGAKND
jgi:hypothetical protein